jgi:hypothetical protein
MLHDAKDFCTCSLSVAHQLGRCCHRGLLLSALALLQQVHHERVPLTRVCFAIKKASCTSLAPVLSTRHAIYMLVHRRLSRATARVLIQCTSQEPAEAGCVPVIAASASARFFVAVAMMCSSTLAGTYSRSTSTGRVWPSRCARACACTLRWALWGLLLYAARKRCYSDRGRVQPAGKLGLQYGRVAKVQALVRRKRPRRSGTRLQVDLGVPVRVEEDDGVGGL